MFGQAFGPTIIPKVFCDRGVVRARQRADSPRCSNRSPPLKEPASMWAELPPLPAARSKTELERRLACAGGLNARVALAQQSADEGKFVQAVRHLCRRRLSLLRRAFTHLGPVLLKKARRRLRSSTKHARDLAPNNWRIRKQIWAIEHPTSSHE